MVASYTAAPKDLKDELQSALRDVERPGAHVHVGDRHYDGIGGLFFEGEASPWPLKSIRTVVRTFLESRDEQIPDRYDRGQGDAAARA